MYRIQPKQEEDPTRTLLPELTAGVIFFLLLFILCQHIKFIEVFEKAKVESLQMFIACQIERSFDEKGYSMRTPRIEVDQASPLIQKIVMSNNTLQFNSGEADFRTGDDDAIVDLVGKVLGKNHAVFEAIKVEGHTDTVVIREPCFASNWELSSGRAATVVHRLTDHSSIPPAKISGVGFSQYHPVHRDSLHLNRRIEFVIQYSYANEFLNGKAGESIYQHLDSLKKTDPAAFACYEKYRPKKILVSASSN